MRHLIIFFLCTVVVETLEAQHTLTIEVNDFRKAKGIFLTGTINNWNPGDKHYQLKRINYFRSEITLHNLPPGKYEFKLTKGSFETVETTSEGDDIPNRVVVLDSDTTILFGVQGWKDDQSNPERLTDSAQLGRAINKGFQYLNTNLDSSFKYAMETFLLSSKVSSLQMKAYAVNLQGELLMKLGNSEKALELFEKGLDIRKALGNPSDSGAVCFLYNQIGDVHWSTNDTIRAIRNYRLSMQWTPDYVYYHPLHELICNRLCNIGRTCLAHNELDSAKWYAARSAEVGDKISTITDVFRGDIETYERNFTKALQYYRSAIELGLHHDNNLELALRACERMVPLFLSLNQLDSAIVYARSAFTRANTLQNNAAVSRSGVVLANLFKELHQYDSAFYYQQKVIESSRKEFTQEKERQALGTYFNEKLKEQALATQKKGDDVKRWLYGLAGVLIVLILLAIRYRIKLKTDYEKKMKEIEMRALRAQMNPHFIFNCLSSINRYIVKSDTKTASQYLTKFAKLIRLILDNSASDHISLDVEIQTLQLYLEMELLRFDRGFEYEIEMDDQLQSEGIQLPSMLIQPYVENAIWHGLLQKEEKGKMWIRFKKINGHILQAEIEDNGIGRNRAMELKSKGTVKHKSYGMQVSSDRIQIINNLYKLNNSVTVHDLTDEAGVASGTKITLKIPVS